MKKLIGTVAVAAMLATAAFAEISLGSWLRVVAAPVAGNGDKIVSGMTNSWGYGARVARVNIYGTSEDEKVGFSMGVYNDAWEDLQPGDDLVIWAKPWNWLRISLGKWDYTTFRGDLCYGSWNWIRPNNWLVGDEGLTFDQLGNQNGLQLEITPVDGLVIMWNLPLAPQLASWEESYKMFQKQHIAAKYTIGSIGTIKAGWGGQEWGDKEKYGDINVAFDLTAVEKLYVTVGAKIAIINGDNKAAGDEFIKVALGASYQILDNLGIAASFALQTYEEYDPSFQFGVGVNFGFTDTLTLNVDFRGLIVGDKGVVSYDPTFSFLVGLQYAMSSNGYVGIGFQGTTNGCGFLSQLGYEDKFSWAVPLAVSCWF